MGSDAESEAKLTAPKLFGRRRGDGRTPKPADAPEEVSEPAPAADSAPERAEAVPSVEPATPVEPATSAEPVETHEVTHDVTPDAAPVVTAERPPREPRQPKEPRQRRVPRPSGVPALSGMQAAAVTGLVVGAFLVLATYGALHLCSTVRGASTCGGRAGFPLLLAIGIVAVVGGGTLLRVFRVTSPMGDSFLAVALVAVLSVLFLNDHYDAWWMLIVVPVLTVVAYVLAHWVSVTYIDPVDE
jgi:hypothetical protein